MIPKVIHYCWFGRNPKPRLFDKCYKSWKKYCPDYEIIEWNEDNYSIEEAPLYVRQAYENKKWAFVSDYARLQIVYENGGIYLDTDVELVKPLDVLLSNTAFFGLEEGINVATGLGFGAIQHFSLIKEIMEDYQNIHFVLPDGSFDLTPCPQRNTDVFLKKGLIQDDSMQTIDDALILPSEYFTTRDWRTGELKTTERTMAIHHADASWYTPEQKKEQKRRFRKQKLVSLPSRIGGTLLGKTKYERIRKILKGIKD